MKRLYTKMISSENQRTHPFGYAEKRFYWMYNLANCNDLKNHKKLYRSRKDNLDGGIGCFLTRIKKENEKQRDAEKTFFKNKLYKKKIPKFLNNNSQRVIYPEKDNEIKRINKKKTYTSQEKNLLHTSGGRISSLFMKTPIQFKYGGKKILNNSIDFGRKKDTHLFSDEFLNDKKYNRIPGVKRKHIISKVNIETEPLNELSFGRKHFYRNKSFIY